MEETASFAGIYLESSDGLTMAEKIKIGLAIRSESFGPARYVVRKAGYEMAMIDVNSIIQEGDPESPGNRVALDELLKQKVRGFVVDYTGPSLLPELKRIGGIKPTVVTVDWFDDRDRNATKVMGATGLKVVRYGDDL
jgi:hypothetical protein